MHVFALTAIFLWKLFSFLSGHIAPQANSTNVINGVLGEKKSGTPAPTPSKSPSPKPTATTSSILSTAQPTTLPTSSPSDNFDTSSQDNFDNSFDFTDTGGDFPDIGTEDLSSVDIASTSSLSSKLKIARERRKGHKKSPSPSPIAPTPTQEETPSQGPSFPDFAFGFLRMLFFPETLP